MESFSCTIWHREIGGLLIFLSDNMFRKNKDNWELKSLAQHSRIVNINKTEEEKKIFSFIERLELLCSPHRQQRRRLQRDSSSIKSRYPSVLKHWKRKHAPGLCSHDDGTRRALVLDYPRVRSWCPSCSVSSPPPPHGLLSCQAPFDEITLCSRSMTVERISFPPPLWCVFRSDDPGCRITAVAKPTETTNRQCYLLI